LESIAKGGGVKNVTFVRIVEPVHLPVGGASDGGGVFTEIDAERARSEIDAVHRAAAKNYLRQLAKRLNYKGVKLQTEVITGRAAENIAEYSEKNNFNLIIIATHGRAGVSRWVWGSVADRILRSSCVPVLMVRAPGCVPNI
jgi:nucleotide-binding universal stress UspA family protein